MTVVIDEMEIDRRKPVWAALSVLWIGWRVIRLRAGLPGMPLE
jgi:hypothetical protein